MSLISLHRARKGQLYLSGAPLACPLVYTAAWMCHLLESFYLGGSAQQIPAATRCPSNEFFHINYPELFILLTTKKMTYSSGVYGAATKRKHRTEGLRMFQRPSLPPRATVQICRQVFPETQITAVSVSSGTDTVLLNSCLCLQFWKLQVPDQCRSTVQFQ